ncbi:MULTISPECIES: hypothetical protein [Streptomyces]|uniref:Site-specific DNA-methyltransferase (cytosine-N(4)-specific) n=1 Tax=Streptomyces koelreuteriae TaxID=2838015 RepID=A0ABX8FWZ0_9ACTN|nr:MULTISPECIES: hypothetical protein [Streptomyces]QWB25718.1 hypothetical protein KJK29_25890 [Streptomyces koelreuteriae]UUA08775.1 hypothetical protein NNW98_26045 [Streptomyces koelreuteriae]UUA16380.1 hypothetical protein NNW99_25930 [Streptomyces sp. CRCS-T-1]
MAYWGCVALIRGGLMAQVVRAYGNPSRLEEYLPDRDEPVDRWFTASNSGNARVIARTIIDLAPAAPSVVIDPFCGAGSSATAARLLGIRFAGAEIDPVLACVSLAKTRCGPSHGADLPRPPDKHDEPQLRCLRLLRELQKEEGGGELSEDQLLADLARAPAPVPGSTVVCGDSTDPANWADLKLPEAEAVMFTSPPFYGDWHGPDVPPPLRAEASDIVSTATNRGRPDARNGPRRGYCDLVVGALQAMESVAVHGTAVVEHEPGDDGTGNRLAVLSERIRDETTADVVEILTTGDFSGTGTLSLVVCRF